MNELWPILIGIGSVTVLILGVYMTQMMKYFTIREHNEFSRAMTRRFDNAEVTIRREFDQIHDRLRILEATRPTTGELEARIDFPKSSQPR